MAGPDTHRTIEQRLPEQRHERIAGVAVYGKRAVVYGSPAILPLPEDAPEQHNCDAMGCGLHHVLWHGEIDR